jgi:hypothetical protein
MRHRTGDRLCKEIAAAAGKIGCHQPPPTRTFTRHNLAQKLDGEPPNNRLSAIDRHAAGLHKNFHDDLSDQERPTFQQARARAAAMTIRG